MEVFTEEPLNPVEIYSVCCVLWLAAAGCLSLLFLFFFAPDSDRQDEHLSVVYSNTGQVSYLDF